MQALTVIALLCNIRRFHLRISKTAAFLEPPRNLAIITAPDLRRGVKARINELLPPAIQQVKPYKA
jgi:hypothetical protein